MVKINGVYYSNLIGINPPIYDNIFFTKDVDLYDECSCCSNKLFNINFDNPVFGTKCIIDIQNKPKNDIINEISEISEIQPLLNNEGNYKLLKYIYDKMCDPKHKNELYIHIIYCKTCNKIYSCSYKNTYKWLGITYSFENEQTEFIEK